MIGSDRPFVLRLARLAVALPAVPFAHAAGIDRQPAEQALPAMTQAMMDAVAKGDRALWNRCLSERATYVLESGERKDKHESGNPFGTLDIFVDDAGGTPRMIERRKYADIIWKRVADH